MAKNRSQDYDVDNRRKETYLKMKGDQKYGRASDNEAGKRFLGQYLEAKQRNDAYPIGNERQRDDRVIYPAANQTNAEISYKNPFRATQS